ncbi:hypothetical protein G6M16_008935 [Agrobacterium tumefaciens]|nr:hypothetical protein G6M16_008935 [Agrobacterium tumefaciens]
MRDIYEVANQLGGFVGPSTDKLLAKFLIREAEEAAELANEIVRLRQLLSEAEKREREARAKALEEAAKACVAEDRHGPWQRTNAGFHFARVISALQSEER